MPTLYTNTLTFTNLADGGTEVKAHGLNLGGAGIAPDHYTVRLQDPNVEFDPGAVAVTYDDTNVTITNNRDDRQTFILYVERRVLPSEGATDVTSKEILTELRIMNRHLEVLTGNEVTALDVENGN